MSDYTCNTCKTSITEEEFLFTGECTDCVNANLHTCKCGAVVSEEELLFIGECPHCINAG